MTRAKDRRDRVPEGTASTSVARPIPADERVSDTVVGALAGRVDLEGELIEPTGDPWDAES